MKVIFPFLVFIFSSIQVFSYNSIDECMVEKMKGQDGGRYLAIKKICENIGNSNRGTNNIKVWKTKWEKDPASGKNIVRSAGINSEDGLCSLSVEKNVAGAEFSTLECPNKSFEWASISVKFDTTDTEKGISSYRLHNRDAWYFKVAEPTGITEFCALGEDCSDHSMPYHQFLKGLFTASYIAFHVQYYTESSSAWDKLFGKQKSNFWVRFSLNGSSSAIPLLGKEVR